MHFLEQMFQVSSSYEVPGFDIMQFSEQILYLSSADEYCHQEQNPDLVTIFLNLHTCMTSLDFTCLLQRQTERNTGMHISIGKKLLCFMGFMPSDHHITDHCKALF